MSFNHCVQFLQQLHVCARNDWPGWGKLLLITTPVSGSSNTEEQDQLYGFTICLLQTDCTCIPLTYIINTWKKNILSNCDSQLGRHAECKYWFSTLTYGTYARTRAYKREHIHTFFTSLYTHNNTLYTNTPTPRFRSYTHAHTHLHSATIATCGHRLTLQDRASEPVKHTLRWELWSPVFASFLSFFAIYLKRLHISWMWRILLFNTKIQGKKEAKYRKINSVISAIFFFFLCGKKKKKNKNTIDCKTQHRQDNIRI